MKMWSTLHNCPFRQSGMIKKLHSMYVWSIPHTLCTQLILHLHAVRLSKYLIHPAAIQQTIGLHRGRQFLQASKYVHEHQIFLCNTLCSEITVLWPRLVRDDWAWVWPDALVHAMVLGVQSTFPFQNRCCNKFWNLKASLMQMYREECSLIRCPMLLPLGTVWLPQPMHDSSCTGSATFLSHFSFSWNISPCLRVRACMLQGGEIYTCCY